MNIASLLARRGLTHPDSPAIAIGTRPVCTYREFADRVARLALALREEYGLRQGDRVALAMRNCPEFLIVLFAAWHAGLCAVPINFRLHRQEFRYILDNCGARVSFVSGDLSTVLSGLGDEVEHLDSIVCVHDDAFTRLVSSSPGSMRCNDVRAEDPAWIFYTSGTTGRPKGATL